MVAKIMTCYISVMVPGRPTVTIIHRQELMYSISLCTMTCVLVAWGDREGRKWSHT